MDPLLKQLLEIPSESYDCDRMWKFLSDYADNNGWSWRSDEIGNLYVQKGTLPEGQFYPCIAAHIDTVHRIEPGGIRAIEIDGKVTGINPLSMEQTGIGGDDKCGIYAALFCLHRLDYCKAAFFVDEEVGCIGSSSADITFFANCRYVLQADRRGYGDFVTNISGPLSSKAFQQALKPATELFGYKACQGMMTDVEALRDAKVGISVANFSAAYYNPHSPDEYIVIHELLAVCAMFLQICEDVTDQFKFTAPKRRSYFRTGRKVISLRKGNAPYKGFYEDDEMWELYMTNRAKELQDCGGKAFPDYEPQPDLPLEDETDPWTLTEPSTWTEEDEAMLRIMRE